MNYIVYDLEATCWQSEYEARGKKQEIIEIGALKIDNEGNIDSRFESFVRPVFHPTLTAFCTDLTSITQVDVNQADKFPIVIEDFQDWIGFYDEEEAKKLEKKIKKNTFDFNDFISQIQQIKKMGNVKDLLGMIPGMGKAIRDVDIDDDAFKGIEAIIQSMTNEERTKPDLIDSSRKKRIAKGSGSSIEDVNKLLKQFQETKKMMKLMSNKQNMKGLMNSMKGMRR